MIGGRPIVVKIAGAVDELKQCELVFIGEIDRDSARRAAHSLSGRPIITVGESNDFVAAGAVFNLLMSDDKVTFQVNTQVARIQQLEVSAKLTRLAKSIH